MLTLEPDLMSLRCPWGIPMVVLDTDLELSRQHSIGGKKTGESLAQR